MKPKIFITIDHLGLGGAQTQVLEYLKHADASAFDIRVITLDATKSLLADRVRELGFEVISFWHKGFLNPLTIFRLVRLFKKEKPNIVHTYLFTADTYGRLAAKIARVPVIITSIRNIDLWKKPHHILVDKILAKFTDRFTINAENIRPFLLKKEGIKSEKIDRIYNGIDLTRFENLRDPKELRKEFSIPEKALVVGMVSRFNTQKDYETYFAAAAEVLKQMPDVYFLAVGDGPQKQSLVARVSELGIEKNVIFTGLRNDVPDVINTFDIGVLASHYEGCPNVVLEYMACGKPAVSADVGGAFEIIRTGDEGRRTTDVTGFLVKPRDSQDLAEKLLLLLKDRHLREQMGKNGRRRAEESFSPGKMAKETERLYFELLNMKMDNRKGKMENTASDFHPRSSIVAFLLSQFPETHETFILREFTGLKEKGMDFQIFSLKKCRDKIIHPEAEAFLAQTIYAPTFGLVSCVRCLVSNPKKFFKAYRRCLAGNLGGLTNILKAHVVFCRAAYLAEKMKALGVSHIHAHWATMPTTAAEVISILLDIPFSFTAHAWDIFLNDKKSLKRKVQSAKFVVTCTKYNKEYLDKLVTGAQEHKDTRDNIIVNYHGLSLSSFKLRAREPVGPLQILAVGRLVEQKGFEYLIKACGVLKRKSMDFHCIIAGEGPLRKSLETLRNQLSLEKFVTMPGVVTQKQIKGWMEQVNVFAAPSVIAQDGDRDGIPNVILEALAMGVPVVASNVSGIPEVIISGQTGILVPPRSEIDLANAFIQIGKKEALLAVFRAQGRKLIEKKFNIDTNVKGLMEIFAQFGVAKSATDPTKYYVLL